MSGLFTNADDRERLLDQLTAFVGSTKRLMELLEHGIDKEQAAAELSMLAAGMLTVSLKDAVAKLLDLKRWQRLAGDADRFDSELEMVFKAIRKILKFAAGVSARKPHRPTTQTVRDENIYLLRAEKGLTFGRIGQRLGISSNQAGLAYKRFEIKDKRRLRGLLETLVDIHDACVQLGIAAPFPSVLPPT